ncbi:MAG TPA: MBL fold metallo-hydrolase [Steroidobacteraceae bacterium]|jgi:beta-lactamase superfamily II metal-dependent hydrolase
MQCEIEFLAVGEGSRAGDAIVVRYGDATAYKLMVIDGGTAETGEKLVYHLKSQFGERVTLEHVVLTHSDADHASGLREVLREIPAANVWLHAPWALAGEVAHFFNGNWSKDGLSAAIKKEYDIVSEIVDLALAAQTTQRIHYPFQGSQIGPFTVLSPSKSTYLRLLPQFEKTPEPNQQLLEAANMWIGKAATAGLWQQMLEKAAAKVSNWVPESWSFERLKDGGQTSASNESSVVLYGNLGDGNRVLLTGDAGVNALTWAINYAKGNGHVLQQFSFVQIPHHGSRRNVGPTVLNELLGLPQLESSPSRYTAFVSAPKDDNQHPRKIVLNAFMRRGGRVIATQGSNKVHWGGFPPRSGYSIVEPLPFSSSVEAYD